MHSKPEHNPLRKQALHPANIKPIIQVPADTKKPKPKTKYDKNTKTIRLAPSTKIKNKNNNNNKSTFLNGTPIEYANNNNKTSTDFLNFSKWDINAYTNTDNNNTNFNNFGLCLSRSHSDYLNQKDRKDRYEEAETSFLASNDDNYSNKGEEEFNQTPSTLCNYYLKSEHNTEHKRGRKCNEEDQGGDGGDGEGDGDTESDAESRRRHKKLCTDWNKIYQQMQLNNNARDSANHAKDQRHGNKKIIVNRNISSAVQQTDTKPATCGKWNTRTSMIGIKKHPTAITKQNINYINVNKKIIHMNSFAETAHKNRKPSAHHQNQTRKHKTASVDTMKKESSRYWNNILTDQTSNHIQVIKHNVTHSLIGARAPSKPWQKRNRRWSQQKPWALYMRQIKGDMNYFVTPNGKAKRKGEHLKPMNMITYTAFKEGDGSNTRAAIPSSQSSNKIRMNKGVNCLKISKTWTEHNIHTMLEKTPKASKVSYTSSWSAVSKTNPNISTPLGYYASSAKVTKATISGYNGSNCKINQQWQLNWLKMTKAKTQSAIKQTNQEVIATNYAFKSNQKSSYRNAFIKAHPEITTKEQVKEKWLDRMNKAVKRNWNWINKRPHVGTNGGNGHGGFAQSIFGMLQTPEKTSVNNRNKSNNYMKDDKGNNENDFLDC